MGFANNYKLNTALQAVTGNLTVAKNIMSQQQSIQISLSESRKRNNNVLNKVRGHFEKYGNNTYDWPQPAITDFLAYVKELNDVNILYFYSLYYDKLVAKMYELQQAVLKLLSKRDARNKFKQYDNYLKELLAYDILTLLYIYSWPWHYQDSTSEETKYVNTDEAMEEALRMFKTKTYKLVNKVDVDTDNVIDRYPSATMADWLNNLENLTATIADA